MIWIWGIFGTILLFLSIDALATTSLFQKIPYLSDWIYLLVPGYYLFVFYLGFFTDITPSFKSILHALFHFIGQMAVFLIFFSFWGVFAIFGVSDYQANTDSLKQEAHELFTELSRIDYPENAELLHSSVSTWGPNMGEDILIKVENIDSFTAIAKNQYDFYKMTMDFPNNDREYLGYGYNPFEETLSPPFCIESKTLEVKPRYFKLKRELVDPENFCGKREVFYSQLKREVELSMLMVILPKEGLVWLNRSQWF